MKGVVAGLDRKVLAAIGMLPRNGLAHEGRADDLETPGLIEKMPSHDCPPPLARHGPPGETP